MGEGVIRAKKKHKEHKKSEIQGIAKIRSKGVYPAEKRENCGYEQNLSGVTYDKATGSVAYDQTR